MKEYLWKIQPSTISRTSIELIGFGRGFVSRKPQDLKKIAENLLPGLVLCSPTFIAGRDHLKGVLELTYECWSGNLLIARNKSIDLLMRITCQSQISKALELSELGSLSKVALFGLIEEYESIEEATENLQKFGWARDDSLLALNYQKSHFLKNFHRFPATVSAKRIAPLLIEKAVLLVFSN